MDDANIQELMRATGTEGYPEDLREFAAAVQAAERERCAKLCEALIDLKARYGEAEYSAGVAECVRRIRGA